MNPAGASIVSGPNGRRLDVRTGGPADGLPLIFHHGTPVEGLLYEPMVQAGAERGIRHITYSRPGYAGSERDPGRSVADCAADVAAVADALEIERFLTVGWSGGGPHAIACAALLPERTLAAATLAGVAPIDSPGLDWFEGMGQDNLDEFGAVRAGESALIAYLSAAAEGLGGATAADIAGEMRSLLSDIDLACVTGEFADFFAASMSGALSSGIWGWFDDDVAFNSPWGFDLGSITRPVTIWQGGEDLMVPFGHGRWLADNVSGASSRLFEDQGHLSIAIGSYPQVLDELIDAADRAASPYT